MGKLPPRQPGGPAAVPDLEVTLPIGTAPTAARLAALFRRRNRAVAPLSAEACRPGISVVIPSRNGKDLLNAQLPGLVAQLPAAGEVLVIDNGSSDGTAQWLESSWPEVTVAVSTEALSFARAVNRGIMRARYSHVCLLNNDMLLGPDFFRALERAFEQVPDLFCATAQIRFPPGVRREETGKAVMAQARPDDFPIRCDDPLPGEDLTYVLYGSGGCSLYDAARLRQLGGLDTAYEPAYVEDLDLGYRAWQHSWPSVYVAAAVVEHRHRATTSRYYTPEQLDLILEINYLKFLTRSVADGALYRRLWKQAIDRLLLRAPVDPAAREALQQAAAIARGGGPRWTPDLAEEHFLALTDGSLWVFPGRKATGKPRVLLAGAADRAAEFAADYDPVLVSFTDRAAPPSADLLRSCVEVVLVRQDQELCFREALHQTIRKWQPEALEFGKTAREKAAYADGPNLDRKGPF